MGAGKVREDNHVVRRRAPGTRPGRSVARGFRAGFDGFAHGPSRQKVTETIEIAAPAEKVWAVIGNFQDLSWLPAVAKTEGTGDNEAR